MNYLELAKYFLDACGDSTHRELFGSFSQDHEPVVHQQQRSFAVNLGTGTIEKAIQEGITRATLKSMKLMDQTLKIKRE